MPLPHLALVVIACLAWAFNFIASATVLETWPPFLATSVRFVLVAILLLPLLQLPPPDQRPRLFAIGLLNGAIHFSFFFFALRTASDISSIAILMQVYVPMAAAFAWILLGERFGRYTAFSIAAASLGVLFVGLDPVVFDRLEAVGFALCGAACLALGTTLMRRLEGVGPFQFQGWTAVVSLPPLAATSVLFERDHLALLRDAPWETWAGVAYSAIAASIVGHGIFFYLVKRHPVARVTTYLLLTPIFAVVLGVTAWGDRPGWRMLLGGSLVLGGVLVISLRAAGRLGRRRAA